MAEPVKSPDQCVDPATLDPYKPTVPGRPMTPGEIAFAQSIYGDKIDYSKVRIHAEPAESSASGAGALSYPDGRIAMYGSNIYPDYSVLEGAHVLGTAAFMHELAHQYQFQNGACMDLTKNYNYGEDLKPGAKWENFSSEQQGEMMQDYIQIYRGGMLSGNIKPEQFNQMRDIVEAQFPNAKATREAWERERASPGSKFGMAADLPVAVTAMTAPATPAAQIILSAKAGPEIDVKLENPALTVPAFRPAAQALTA